MKAMPGRGRKVALPVAVAVLLMGVPSWGQEPVAALSFLGERIAVDMPQAEAEERLRRCRVLSGGPVNPEPSGTLADAAYFISTAEGPPFRSLGEVHFSGGRVGAVERYVTTPEQEGPAEALFSLTLYRLLAEMTNTPSVAVVETSSQELTNGFARSIYLRFPSGRSVEISISTLDGTVSVAGLSRDGVRIIERLTSAAP